MRFLKKKGMKKITIITALVLALIGSGLYFLLRTSTIKPPEREMQIVHIEVPESTVNLPIRIDIQSLADYLNGKISGRFLDTTLYLQESKKEQIALTLTKAGNITIRSTGKELVCSFPLQVNATLLQSRVGKLLTKLVKPLHTKLIITLSTPLGLDRKWRLKTRFRMRGYEWITEPVLQIGPFRKNLRNKIDEAISKKCPELTAMLDKEIINAASLQKTVAEIWYDLHDPIRVSSKPAPVWIRFFCNDLEGDIRLEKSHFICFASIKAKMMMVTDTTSEAKPTHFPDFKQLSMKDRKPQSTVYLYAFTSFDEINRHLNELVTGKMISARGYNITIEKIHAYASKEGLVIQLTTGRDLRGDLFLKGHPVFDVPRQRLEVKNFDFALNTNRILVSKGEQVMHDIVRERVAAKLNLGLDTLIAKVPMIVHQAIAKGNSGKTIDLRMNNLDIKRCDIQMGKEKIHFLIEAGTEANLKLKKIKSGRPLKIGNNSA